MENASKEEMTLFVETIIGMFCTELERQLKEEAEQRRGTETKALMPGLFRAVDVVRDMESEFQAKVTAMIEDGTLHTPLG